MPAKRPDSVAQVCEELLHGEPPLPLRVTRDAEHRAHTVMVEALHLLELLFAEEP